MRRGLGAPKAKNTRSGIGCRGVVCGGNLIDVARSADASKFSPLAIETLIASLQIFHQYQD